jgi:hypothetical protein
MLDFDIIEDFSAQACVSHKLFGSVSIFAKSAKQARSLLAMSYSSDRTRHPLPQKPSLAHLKAHLTAQPFLNAGLKTTFTIRPRLMT